MFQQVMGPVPRVPNTRYNRTKGIIFRNNGMDKLLETIEVNSNNGLYRIYLFSDNNPLLRLEIYKIDNGIETPVKNMYRELKRLNEEFSFRIEYEPKERTRLNTREFGREFIRRHKGI